MCILRVPTNALRNFHLEGYQSVIQPSLLRDPPSPSSPSLSRIYDLPSSASHTLPSRDAPLWALAKEEGFKPYKSLRMSRGRKMSLGSVCRLLLASELQERTWGHLQITPEAKGHGARGFGPIVCVCVMYSQVCQRLESSEGKPG